MLKTILQQIFKKIKTPGNNRVIIKKLLFLERFKMSKPIVLGGICHIYSEQGIGPLYTFWESKHIHPPPDTWDFAGLHVLKDGDRLTIFDKRDKRRIVWSGFISLWQNRRGRSRQRGVNHKRWSRWFTKEYPAEFTPGPDQTKRP